MLSTSCFRWMSVYNIKMLYYDRSDVSEGTDVEKTRALKDCDVCHYGYFLNYSFNQMFVIIFMI